METNLCPRCKAPLVWDKGETPSVYCMICGYRKYEEVIQKHNFKRDKTLKVCICGKEFKDKRPEVINRCHECNKRKLVKEGKIDKYKKRTEAILKELLTSEQFEALGDLCQFRKEATSN